MMKKRNSFVFTACFVVAVAGIVFSSGCQYDYVSPLPGIINVRLRTKSENLEFSPLNNFVLKVTTVEAVRNDRARAVIYEDTKAIGRTTNVYNTLDVRARDSNIVMGEAYLPPGDYIGVNLLIQPGESVVLDGYRIIPVVTPESFDALLAFRQNFKIQEGVTTKIVVTIDLDNALLKGANNYYFSTLTSFPLLSEGFDTLSSGSSTVMGALPSGWSRNINSNDPSSGAWGIRDDASSQGYSGASSGKNCYTSYTQAAGSWVQTPAVNIANMDFVGMRFGARFSDGDTNRIHLAVDYSADGASFSSVPDGLLISPGNETWNLKILLLPKVNSSAVYLRWTATGEGEQSDVRIDDVKVIGRRFSYYISSIQYSSQ